MSEIKEAKSLRWLAIQFPLVKKPKDDIEKMQSCINLYCTSAAEKIEQLTAENEGLYRTLDDKIQENKRLALLSKATAEVSKTVRNEVIDEFADMVRATMREVATGKRTSLVGIGWLDQIVKELKGE